MSFLVIHTVPSSEVWILQILCLYFFEIRWETLNTELDKTCVYYFTPVFVANLCLNFVDWVKEVLYERKFRGKLLGYFFPLYTGVTLPIYVPTTGFRLMVLRNIRVEKVLLRLPVLQWNKHPTQFNLKK